MFDSSSHGFVWSCDRKPTAGSRKGGNILIDNSKRWQTLSNQIGNTVFTIYIVIVPHVWSFVSVLGTMSTILLGWTLPMSC